MLNWPPKAPDEILDYSLDWSARIVAGDKIISSNWDITPTNDLVISSNLISNSISTVWLNGGTLNTTYFLKNKVTTINGREMDQTVSLTILNK